MTIDNPLYIMRDMSDSTDSETNKLLRAIIALLVKDKAAEARTMREQIKLLADVGLKPKEIAAVVGRTRVYVTKELNIKDKAQRKDQHGE